MPILRSGATARCSVLGFSDKRSRTSLTRIFQNALIRTRGTS